MVKECIYVRDLLKNYGSHRSRTINRSTSFSVEYSTERNETIWLKRFSMTQKVARPSVLTVQERYYVRFEIVF